MKWPSSIPIANTRWGSARRYRALEETFKTLYELLQVARTLSPSCRKHPMVNETCRVISFHQGAATELEANIWVTTQNIFPSIPSIAERKSRRSYPDNLRGRSIVWDLHYRKFTLHVESKLSLFCDHQAPRRRSILSI